MPKRPHPDWSRRTEPGRVSPHNSRRGTHSTVRPGAGYSTGCSQEERPGGIYSRTVHTLGVYGWYIHQGTPLSSSHQGTPLSSSRQGNTIEERCLNDVQNGEKGRMMDGHVTPHIGLSLTSLGPICPRHTRSFRHCSELRWEEKRILTVGIKQD